MSWGSRKKKLDIFITVYFVRRIFFNICVLSQCTLSEYTIFYISKNITSYSFLLVFKIVESLQCILKLDNRKLLENSSQNLRKIATPKCGIILGVFKTFILGTDQLKVFQNFIKLKKKTIFKSINKTWMRKFLRSRS